MTEFDADESYGDLDVLAFRPGENVIYSIECKRLRFARTNAEIGEQLREFQGEEMDRLARHVRRCKWLETHPEALRRVTGAPVATLRIVPLLVTSTVVPMQFTQGLPLGADRIVPFARLQTWLEDDFATRCD
jgi:hypothetical protein